jgi:alpha-D-xyloside xylohydrolase
MRLTYPRLLILSLTVSLLACRENAEPFTREGSSVLIHPASGPAKVIRLNVVSDKIIRVTASPTDTLSTTASLMIVPGVTKQVDFHVAEKDGGVSITTKSLVGRIDLKTGALSFLDSAGNALLTEKSGGGKGFEKTTLPKLYKISQSFESPDDEGFYGLGAHQNRQMNYKGDDVDLVQHNIADVVPFLYSTKNYGLLWDNYSMSKFGDSREYQPLSSLKLTPKEGTGAGLTASYYVENKIIKTAVEDKIDFEYLETPQGDSFPRDVAAKGKVIWEGRFSSDKEGDHKFLVYASGYFKVWIGDKLIMDKWRQGWNPWTNKFKVNLKAGESKTIKVEWTPDGGAYLAVKHLDPISSEEQNRLTITSNAGENIDYYFVKGNSADDVISGYRTLTGKAPIVPKWAMGFWQSRERYRSQEELVNTVKEYRKRRIPLDNIVLDWQYWEDPKWGSHEFDATRFPDPKGMMDQLHHELHANLMISVWPKYNKGTSNYDEMNSKGFLFTRNIEMKRKDWVGPGYENTFYDPFNPEAGKLFWKQIDTGLNTLGVDAWWLDATEPDMHSNLSLEERVKNMSPTALGPGEQYFNGYSLMNAKSVYEGQRKSSPDKRVFILTRSAYAGQQRYGAATWSGDIVSRWSDFEDQIYAGINIGLSGIPYWTTDIGGFAVERRYYNPDEANLAEWRELNTRWFQFGAFLPLFRSHGQYPLREIFNISPEGHPAYMSMTYYTNLRYRLMPYLYTLAGDCYWKDYTMMRGLVMDFSDDPKVRNIGDQYMLGPALLVNPVYEYKATSRKVYLPSSTGWFDFYTGQYYKGGQTIVSDAPYERIPLYVKEGSILPMGPEIQYATEKPADPTTLYVFTGSNATFRLYEDENVNYKYESGAWAGIPITWDEDAKTLTIGTRQGSFKDMLEARTFHIIWVKTDHPAGASYMAQPPQVVPYSGNEITVNLK